MKRSGPIAAFLLALVVAVAATWPVASAPGDAILCNYIHPDCLSNHWLMVWVAEQLATGGSILHNTAYYWPVGDAPWLAGNGSEGFGYLPFHLVFGWPVGSTVYLVGVLVLNGFGAYFLARAAGASVSASLAAAPTGAAMLYAIHELGAGRFSQVSFCWMALFLAAWLRFLRRPSVLGALGAAALLAITSLFYWYYGLFSVLAGGLLLLAFLPREDRPPLRALVIFSASYLALVGPLLWVFLRYWSSIPGTGEDVFPHPESVGDSTWPGVPFLVSGGRHAGRALPFTTVALAFVATAAAIRRPRPTGEADVDARSALRRRVVWALAGVAMVFALLMAGALIPHGPYEWIYGLAGPLRRFWWPYRHVIALNLALTTLAALGADVVGRTIAARWPRARRWGVFGGALVALSVPLQLTVQGAPWHVQFTEVELEGSFYPKLRDLPGTVLVEPPLAPGVASAQTPLIYQLLHGKTLLAGHAMWVERVRPDAWDTFVAKNTFLVAMQRLERGELGETFTFDPADLHALIDAGARTFVLNQEYFPLSLRALVRSYEALFDTLFGDPVATGTRVKAWDAGRWDGTSTVTVPVFTWPPEARMGGPTLAMQGMRPPSPVFTVPSPKDGKKPPPPPKGAGSKAPEAPAR